MPKGTYKRTEKYKASMKGTNNPFFGKKHSLSVRRKMRLKKLKNPTKYWLNKESPFKGIPRSNVVKLKISKANSGKNNGMFGTHLSEEAKRKLREHNLGDKGSNWQGGISSTNHRIRRSLDGKLWIKAVFSRDNYTDQKTGIRGGTLHAHHIQNFAEHPELRFNVNNGITLSKKSHKEFHQKYGRTSNTRKQLAEFLKN